MQRIFTLTQEHSTAASPQNDYALLFRATLASMRVDEDNSSMLLWVIGIIFRKRGVKK